MRQNNKVCAIPHACQQLERAFLDQPCKWKYSLSVHMKYDQDDPHHSSARMLLQEAAGGLCAGVIGTGTFVFCPILESCSDELSTFRENLHFAWFTHPFYLGKKFFGLAANVSMSCVGSSIKWALRCPLGHLLAKNSHAGVQRISLLP